MSPVLYISNRIWRLIAGLSLMLQGADALADLDISGEVGLQGTLTEAQTDVSLLPVWDLEYQHPFVLLNASAEAEFDIDDAWALTTATQTSSWNFAARQPQRTLSLEQTFQRTGLNNDVSQTQSQVRVNLGHQFRPSITVQPELESYLAWRSLSDDSGNEVIDRLAGGTMTMPWQRTARWRHALSLSVDVVEDFSVQGTAQTIQSFESGRHGAQVSLGFSRIDSEAGITDGLVGQGRYSYQANRFVASVQYQETLTDAVTAINIAGIEQTLSQQSIVLVRQWTVGINNFVLTPNHRIAAQYQTGTAENQIQIETIAERGTTEIGLWQVTGDWQPSEDTSWQWQVQEGWQDTVRDRQWQVTWNRELSSRWQTNVIGSWFEPDSDDEFWQLQLTLLYEWE